MSHTAEVQLIPAALAANVIVVPFEKHINLVYIGLSILFACVLVYWFIYTRRH
jgi:hypothetical protein